MSRNYHNLVSHYNGYFNAREILKAENRMLVENHKDDYSQVLPLFIYPTEDQSKAMIPQMDVVIEKSSKVIERHSIYKRKKEHVKWIDDTYYLIGQAQFNKGMLVSAEETFLYVYQAFKKEPIRYDGLLWLIKTLIEEKDWEKVDTYTRMLEDDINFPKEKEGLYNVIYPDYLLKKDKDIEKAIPRLEEAVNLTEDKESKRRYTYILAQLYQKKGYLKKANDLYADVLKLRPDYVMAFNCKINRAIAYDVASNNAEDIKKQLRKMLKDSKNEEFFDQIYFALAELAITQKDEPLAVQYLKKSAQVSTVNVKQKALSYYKLAEIYFARPDYINAQSYFDSTTIYLPKDHEAYYLADEKNKSLLELVKNLKIVQLQDSLLKISNLSDKEQRRLVNDIISEYKSTKERDRLATEAAQLAAQNGGRSAVTVPGGSSSWYFYNPTSMTFGMSEFKRMWGDRSIQDNWRRSNKQSAFPNPVQTGVDPNDGIAVTDGAVDTETDPNLNQDNYLKNIPKDYNEKLIAHGKVVDALYNIGLIFKESFEDFPSGINAFERIVNEYDTSQKALPAHYQLYRIYLKQEEKALAERHKDWVLENHPFSEYAYIIKNPNYNKQTKATKEKVESFYTATYRLYEYGLYSDVISSCDKADSVFNSDHLKAKFDYLRAKAVGKVRPLEEFKSDLQAVIADHPNDPVKDQAQSILDYINKNKSTPAVSTKSSYVFNPDEGHIVLVEVNANNNKNDALKNQIAIFNQKFFRNEKFDVSKILIGGDQGMLMIRNFDSKIQAMNYYGLLTRTSDIAETVNGITYVISNENLRLLFKEKNLPVYITFFNEHYQE